MAIFRTISSDAQYTPCGTPSPTAAELANIPEASSSTPEAPLVWEVPVQVTVCDKDDSTGWTIALDAALIDAVLENMNTELDGLPNGNTFHFFRCGPINYIYETDVYNGQKNVENYSYVPNFLNLYVYNKQGTPPFAHFPWDNPSDVVHLTSGIGNSDTYHELGHTLGLFHTFDPSVLYTVPVTLSQSDYPDNSHGARELVIRDVDDDKEFSEPNWEQGGDRVGDTPPGCNPDTFSTWFFPSSATIAGCLDGDPNTPCVNGCLDIDPNTPCVSGCTYDYTNCTYTGDYRDYNFDLVVDTANVLAKNYMSYTGSCRQEFTLGQKIRADNVFNLQLSDYYQPSFCNNFVDRVEIEETTVGLNRVALQITPVGSPEERTKAVTSPSGDFSGKLPGSVTTNADVRKWGSGPNFSFTTSDWLYGVSTFDLVLISKHILGLDTLDGYAIIAADANDSRSITTFDIVELRKLILGIYDSLPAHDQPWQFIPEYVTLKWIDGVINPQFDGVGYDAPFGQIVTGHNNIPAGAPYLDAGFEIPMRPNIGRSGFDAVKIGNANGVYPTPITDNFVEECPDEITMIVPAVSIEADEEVSLTLKGFNFNDIVAFQLGFFLSNDEIEYVSAASTSLSGFTEETSVGASKLTENELSVVWMDDNLSPKTIQNGGSVFSLQLKAKKDIQNLQDAFFLNDGVLESFFLALSGDCIGNASLQVEVDEVLDRGNGENSNPIAAARRSMLCVPNPVKEDLKIVLDAEQDFEGNILLHDPLGRLLKSVPCAFVKGRNIVEIDDISALPAGLLNVSVLNGDTVFSSRIFKL